MEIMPCDDIVLSIVKSTYSYNQAFVVGYSLFLFWLVKFTGDTKQNNCPNEIYNCSNISCIQHMQCIASCAGLIVGYGCL